MGEHRAEAAEVEIEEDLLEERRGAGVRRLDEQVGARAEAKRAQRVRLERGQAGEGDLAAGHHRERHVAAGEGQVQLAHPAAHVERIEVVLERDVRSRDHHGDSIGRGGPGHSDGGIHVRGPVIDAGEDVGVEIDGHGPVKRNLRIAPGRRLKALCEGSWAQKRRR